MAKQTFTTGQVLTAAQVNALQTNDFNQTVSVKTASYVLVAADKGTRIEFNTSGSVTCTVNTGLFDAGDTLIVQNRGAGAVTITAGTATVNTSGSLVVNQYESGTLYFISASAALWFGSNPGDITGITTGATSGLTGGVTSGTADLKFNTTAKGALLVGTGTGTVTELTVGSNNTVLTADSTTASGLKWATASSGGLTLIETLTLTGSSVTSSTLPTSYRNLYIEVSGYFASAEVFFGMRLNSDSGTNYTEWSTRWQTSGTNFGPSGSNTTRIGMIDPNDIGLPTSNKYNVSIAYIFGYNDTDKYKLSKVWNHHMNNSNVSGSTNLVSTWRNNAAVTTLNFYLGSGTFSGGTVKIYGVN